MRRIAWAFSALAGLTIACGPTGQTEVKAPPELQSKGDDGAANADAAKKNPRAKSANTNDMPSMKPID